MRHCSSAPAAVASLLAFCTLAKAVGGEFERLEGARLAAVFESETARPFLTAAAVVALPRLLRDADGGLVLVKTDQGSLAKLIVSFGLRKSPGATEGPLPVVVIERFETFEPGKAGGRTAKGGGVLLFNGFTVDLDGGCVVPAGQGGDLVFLTGGEKGPRLEALAGSTAFAPEKLPPVEQGGAGPSTGKGIVPGDFLGRYRLVLDGKWAGTMDLAEVQGRDVVGRFRSEPNGSSYPISGRIDPGSPNALAFTLRFPRSELQFQGRLWSEGKSGLSGTYTSLDKTFGFVAVREGAALPVP